VTPTPLASTTTPTAPRSGPPVPVHVQRHRAPCRSAPYRRLTGSAVRARSGYVQLDNAGYGRFVSAHAGGSPEAFGSSDGNLALSPQGGFASVAEGGNDLTAEEQFAKLRLVADTARAIRGSAG
jgi:hypothetical protein